MKQDTESKLSSVLLFCSIDHIWDFKYLLVRCSSVSGDFELHTTPWSSCECLFDDDKRAVEFKEQFQRSKLSCMQVTKLSAHLEEKCSGKVVSISLMSIAVYKPQRCSNQVKYFSFFKVSTVLEV